MYLWCKICFVLIWFFFMLVNCFLVQSLISAFHQYCWWNLLSSKKHLPWCLTHSKWFWNILSLPLVHTLSQAQERIAGLQNHGFYKVKEAKSTRNWRANLHMEQCWRHNNGWYSHNDMYWVNSFNLQKSILWVLLLTHLQLKKLNYRD